MPKTAYDVRISDWSSDVCSSDLKRGSTLLHGESPVQATTRYYVSTDGAPLTKVSPPPAGCRIGHYKKGAGVPDHVYHATDNTVWNAELERKSVVRGKCV